MGGNIVEAIVTLAMIAVVPGFFAVVYFAIRWISRRRTSTASQAEASATANPIRPSATSAAQSSSRTYAISAAPLPVRFLTWLAIGSIGGAALYAAELPGVAIGVVLLALAVMSARGTRPAVPAYLIGLGVTGVVLALTMSPNGAWSVATTGHSAVCSSAGGCVGSTVTQSALSVPAVAVFATAMLVGALWLSWQAIRLRAS